MCSGGGLFYKFLLGLILILIVITIGISYAYWQIQFKEDTQNIASTKCFKVSITNESESITLDDLTPITDEEGLQNKSYDFTIKNTCNTYATYQINLEDILDNTITKRLSNKYIKVSLNDSTPKVLNNYKSVTPTINNADASFKLTSGSLGPSGSDKDSVTYSLKLWMDYDTPAIDEVMSATFKSKISVVSVYTEEENLNNEITINYTSNGTEYTNTNETIDINATSKNYNLIEYSLDNNIYTSIDNPSKDVTITKTFTEDKEQTIYFRDEVGNLKSKAITLAKLDQTGPSITTTVSDEWATTNTITINLEDSKSGLSGYAITDTETEPETWESISGKTTTITKEINTNGTYYIYAKDVLGNISHIRVTVDKIDDKKPTAKISAIVNNNTITVSASGSSDSESGIAKYEYSLDGTTYYSSAENSYTFTGVSDGTYKVYLKVTDNVSLSTIVSTSAVVAYQTVYISSNGSDEDGYGSVNNPYATLTKAYEKVMSGGNIKVIDNVVMNNQTNFDDENKMVYLSGYNSQATIKRGNTATNSSLINVINQNILVIEGIVIDGQDIESNGPLISVNDSELTLSSDTVIKNANNINNAFQGGGIDARNSSIIRLVNGAIITNNKTTLQGGGLMIYQSTLLLVDATISNNKITNLTGNAAGPGGIMTWESTIAISGGTIENNTGAWGGGLVINGESADATLDMTGGTISGNTANRGGGILIQSGASNKTTVTISNGTISDNVSKDTGGGIAVMSSNTTLSLKGGTVANNTALNNGGGLTILNEATAYMSNTTIVSNKTTSNASVGGGVAIWSKGKFYLQSGVIQNNTAVKGGGGIAFGNSGTLLNISGGSIVDNKSTNSNSYGGIFGGSDGEIYNYNSGTIKNNTPLNSNK